MANIISAWVNPGGRKVPSGEEEAQNSLLLCTPNCWLCSGCQPLAGSCHLSWSLLKSTLWHTALHTRGYLGSGNKSAVGFLGPDFRAVQHLLKTERTARGEPFWRLPWVGVMGAVLALGFLHLPIAWKPFQSLFKGIPN